jgi:hypothetical protein
MFTFTAMVTHLPHPTATFERLTNELKRYVPTFAGLLDIVGNLPANSIFIAGGAARDSFLRPDRKPKDLDLFLSFAAFEAIEPILLHQGLLQTNQFGTYRWFGHGDGAVYYDIIIIEKFSNGLWACRDITDVLNQFDITANAIAFDLKTGTCYDPQNGLLDIRERILRAVRFDYPELMVSSTIQISRNTVLWFRYQHYSKVLQLSLDQLTAEWIAKNNYRKQEADLFKQHFFEPYLHHD